MISKGVIIAIIIAIVLVAGAWIYTHYVSVNAPLLYLKESYPPSNHALNYATLGTMSAQPLFEPDAIRKCADGAYMYTDNPQMMSFCSSLPSCALKAQSCGCGLMGQPPYRVRYTQPSCVQCESEPECGQCESSCAKKFYVPAVYAT